VPLPTQNFDYSDPGDLVQQKFRYQHAYTVILLCLAARQLKNITSVWCEQKEDILCRYGDGTYSYYQIKTRKSELGYWTLSDVALIKSIGRFVSHESKYGLIDKEYVFVSNCEFKRSQESTVESERANSPINFFKNINDSKKISDLKGEFKLKLQKISKAIGCECKILYKVIRKTQLVHGPDELSIDSDLTSNHLSTLNELENLPIKEIHKLRDELIYLVFKSSSYHNDIPDLCAASITNGDADSLRIKSKMITVESFLDVITTSRKIPFTYFSGSSTLQLGEGSSNLKILRKKLEKGGLTSQTLDIERKALSAEQQLLEMVAKDPHSVSESLDQIESGVLSVCSEAILDYQDDDGNINAIRSYRHVRNTFRDLEKSKGSHLFDTSEFNIGIAGLLTGECKIWWSDTFDLELDK
jgi:hypothetical protein